jgi:hypothetical protein
MEWEGRRVDLGSGSGWVGGGGRGISTRKEGKFIVVS